MKTLKKILSVVLALTLCATTLSLLSCGKDNGKDTFTVGICQLAPHVALDAATQGFIDALNAELGAENVTIINKNASGEIPNFKTIVSSFVSQNVDLIMANATPALQAAYAATEQIPILGTSVTEYGVALGIENFSGVTGTNVSGTSDLAPLADQAQMIIDLFPDAQNVGILYCSSEANSKYQVEVVKAFLESKGKTVKTFSFSDSNDVIPVTTQAAQESDVLYIPTDNVAASNAETIRNTLDNNPTPVITGEEGVCKSCGVATLTIDYYDLGYATGLMAAKILKGEAKVSEMPIEYAPNFTKKYNPTICAEFGIDTAALEAQGYVAIETN
ncbi:MAG: ABC transporter substrate-binding protein [Clostridia bacterium]|nr:ABC transporter substrate-binding protein [Clostridia bacterium]